MRVLEPHQFGALQKKRKSSRKVAFVVGASVVMLAVPVGVAYAFLRPKAVQQQAPSMPTVLATASKADEATAKTKPKTFTANEFRDLYRSVLATYPNTEAFPELPTITSDEAADARIRQVAEARGFQLTRIPVAPLIKTNEPLLKGESDDLLQPLAYQGWKDIETAAQKDSIPLQLLSAYRSPEWQRDLFMERFAGNGGSAYVAAHGGEGIINRTLGMTSVPGYSRHHTGYTVDFACEGYAIFARSPCDDWLQLDNYIHAKNAGWIPSYPKGADEQGPEPEPWEYVWVGRNVLFE